MSSKTNGLRLVLTGAPDGVSTRTNRNVAGVHRRGGAKKCYSAEADREVGRSIRLELRAPPVLFSCSQPAYVVVVVAVHR